jgi:hypothetical protein
MHVSNVSMDGKKNHLFFKSFEYRLQIPPPHTLFVLIHRAKKHVFVSGSSPKAFHERLLVCRLRMAIFNWPLPITATKNNDKI